jgi:ADP-ribose pyrophosphatase YjhB (NUDIX family)
VVVVIVQDGNVLLGKRSGGFGVGKWGLPQGYIETDEDYLSAAVREVKEETGLDVEIRSIINVVSNLISARHHTLAVVLLANAVGGQPMPGDDLSELRWVPLSGPLPEMAFDADRMIIEKCRGTDLRWGLPVSNNRSDQVFVS